MLAAETDNPDERAACDQEFVAMVLVGGAVRAGNVYVRPATSSDERGVEVDASNYARVDNLR